MCDFFFSYSVFTLFRGKEGKEKPLPPLPLFHTPDFEMMMNTDLDTSACLISFFPLQYLLFQGKEGKGKPLPPLPFSHTSDFEMMMNTVILFYRV